MACMKDVFVKGQLLDGRFRSIAPLNHGSFGMVFVAEDVTTRQQVAIKCLTKPAANNPNASIFAADEGVEELACHDALKYHDNLVNLVDHFETDAHTYLVIEYCSQGDLYEAIRLGRGPLETEHVRDFMLQLINAVDHMHSRGLYHRDIKPENIFITQDGSLKLGDFGLATRSPWCYESCVGSDRYMAPEQYDPAGNGYSPAKADIWSIGICLLNVLFSRNPFVTPTESDILFADYRRDRQSLFDVFPNMSQDTFEVLTTAMAIDPQKRDLSAVRQAILRVVSFTTDDESMDEFCNEERDIVRASANREPLRTPSIQSPQLNAGDSFPWASALHTSPGKQHRQLSAIPDTESYDEDLFAPSENSHSLGQRSWFSAHAATPSLASVLDSAFGASFKSMAIPAKKQQTLPHPDPVPVTGSLPIQASRPIPTMSMVFGKKKDSVAKSWSDMWEEEEEESEQEELAQTEQNAKNTRTWSHESRADLTVRPGILTESKSHSSMNVRPSRDHTPMPEKRKAITNENEPFGFQAHYQKRSPGRGMDKWADLGNKRRNCYHQQPKEVRSPSPPKKRSMTTGGWRKETKRGSASSGSDQESSWHRKDSRCATRPVWLESDWRQKRNTEVLRDDETEDFVGGWNKFHL